MNKLFEIQLDLLETFKSVCAKYNLNYYACCGTLLGAVRHHGFIPWDDDIDLYMPFSDYKRLMMLAVSEFQYPYFLQCIYTERDSILSGARLRRSDTTGFTMWEMQNVRPDYDKGIFIDIFPLFYVPDSPVLRQKQWDDVMFYWKSAHGFDAVNQRNRGVPVNPQYEKYLPIFDAYCEMEGTQNIDIVKLKERYYDACDMVKIRTKEIGPTSAMCHHSKFLYNTEWFDKYIDIPFENTTICCPADFDRILERQYGDWRTPVKGSSIHTMAGLDPYTPWREFDMSSISIK